MTFIYKDAYKFAVDPKSTYRIDSNRVNTMTLGAFTGYFRNRDTTKNILFPYNHYSGHFVVGAIYSRAKLKTSEIGIHGLNELQRIPSVIKDVQFFAQP